MKKVLSLLLIFIAFIIIYFLQSNFFMWFNIAGVKPNLFIILALVVGLFIGKTYGMACGITFGIFIDLFIGKLLGINAIVLGIAGLMGGIFVKNFSKDSRMTFIVTSAFAVAICEFLSYILQIILYKLSFETGPFLRIILLEIIFNSLIIMIIYPIIEKLGEKLEKVFTESKIKTRYY